MLRNYFIYFGFVCLFLTPLRRLHEHAGAQMSLSAPLVHIYPFTYKIYIYHSFSFFTTHTTRTFHTEAVFVINDGCGILLKKWQVQANSGPATQKPIYSVMYRRLVADKIVLVA